MEYILSKQFEKKFSKLPQKTKNKVIEKLKIFISDPMDERLNNHSLSGKWRVYRSINITGNVRAIYTTAHNNIVRFIDIGSHSDLYS